MLPVAPVGHHVDVLSRHVALGDHYGPAPLSVSGHVDNDHCMPRTAALYEDVTRTGLFKADGVQLTGLIENDRDWETSTLIDRPEGGTRIHHDHRTIGQNVEGEFHAPVHNNNYSGYSDEEFERELQRRTSLKDQQIASLEEDIVSLRQQLAREISRNERLMGILERVDFHKGEEKA